MPIYTFRCDDCAHEEDLLVDRSELDQPRQCSACASEKVQRQFPSQTRFNLAGRCWSRDGYTDKGDL